MSPGPPGSPGAALYPVVLCVAGRPCLVVGGGPVAARKAAGLAGCGATVTVVAPRICVQLEAMARAPRRAGEGTVALVRRPYRPGDVEGHRLVITATGVASVDAAVAADAEAAGTWVNSADDPVNCTFVLPSVHRDGPVTIAVSTSGTSPALAVWLRRRIGQALPPGAGFLAELLAGARRRIKAAGRSTEGLDWAGILDGQLPALVAAGQMVAAGSHLDGRLGLSDRSPGSTEPDAPAHPGGRHASPPDPVGAVGPAARRAGGPAARAGEPGGRAGEPGGQGR